MKTLYVIIIMLGVNLTASNILGQGRAIDISACNEWERLIEIEGKTCLLSSDGNFVLYKMISEKHGSMTVLKDLKLDIEKRFPFAHDEISFNEGQMFSFQLPGDSLVIFDTQKKEYNYIIGVTRYFVVKSETVDMIAYFTKQNAEILLTVWDVKMKRKLNVEVVDVVNYWLNKKGTVLLIKGPKGMTHIELNSFKQVMVTSNTNIENVSLSYSGDEIVYISHDVNGYELKYFNVYSKETNTLVNDSSYYLKNNWKLEPKGLFFDNDDGNVFFKISRANSYYDRRQDSIITRDVNVWSYQDLYLQESQLSTLPQRPAFIAMINVQQKKIVQLENEELSLELLGNTSKYFVLTTRINENEFYWNNEKKGMYLFSTVAGSKTLIKESQYPGFQFIGISPNNRFLIWFDAMDGNYYSYNIVNGRISNISRRVDGSFSMLNQRGEAAKSISRGYPYSGQYWMNNGELLIVNSKNDIWQLDPFGGQLPINLTNGYGTAKNIRFRLVDAEKSLLKVNSNEYLVWGFDNKSKQNGFWRTAIGTSKDPIKMVMSDDAYFFSPQSPIISANTAEDPRRFKPVKALGKDLYVVRVMSSSKAPNLFYTTDFKGFYQLSNIVPNKEYLWSSTKLITWILPDGQRAEGILHKPNNFDSTKKYPIIFNYYERRSECLNVFKSPELSGHNINIPWYVSRGYLVFEPDFYYKRGKTAQSVIEAVESALGELRKLTYIDQNRMGIQGQSHGGYETNILATGTQLFAAACEMAGFTNIISEYGSIRPGGINNQSSADVGQRNLGVFPWEYPEIFIENSPIFHVSKMKTPLLMVHNKDDNAVLFSQAIELYLSMRRLRKEVWLLQYDEEGHSIYRNNNKLDFTIRMQQFFDHYLKGAPAPIWMSQGVPASLKGVVSGLKYETSLMGRNK